MYPGLADHQFGKEGNVDEATHAAREQVDDRGAETINQAKQKAGEVYDQANKRLSEQYEKAINYGRENPGKTTLIAFGVGALLVSNFSASRSRRSRKPNIYRDVYDRGANTEDNLRNVLQAYGVTIDQLSEGRRSQVTNALS